MLLAPGSAVRSPGWLGAGYLAVDAELLVELPSVAFSAWAPAGCRPMLAGQPGVGAEVLARSWLVVFLV